MCRKRCEFGYKSDSFGCDVCECADPPYESSSGMECPEFSCYLHCPHGFEKDQDGCDMCKCREIYKRPDHTSSVRAPEPVNPRCQQITCYLHCDAGFRKDMHGCPICQCADTNPRCPPLECSRRCPFGYKKDEGGCPMCQCDWDMEEEMLTMTEEKGEPMEGPIAKGRESKSNLFA